MPEVLIVIDAETEPAEFLLPAVFALDSMISAFQQAIASTSASPHSSAPTVRVITTDSLDTISASDVLLCPFTLNLPATLSFPAQQIYRVCRDIVTLRQRVEGMGYATGAGNFWLPVVLTSKGPLYAEVIGLTEELPAPKPSTVSPSSSFPYCQPVHLSDAWRQQLYKLAGNLLRSLDAPPATYLMQFGFQEGAICFDRLWPFPAAPALASLSVQEPNLFTCHWYCLAGQPILDVTISGSSASYLHFE
ncbi:hypothetical protein [Microcoleus sp. FACHB-672]|uniref:hypothetical protein n=1 Tax=Microcoleus sp. FACHB-672 TaxID=2692825 RepID=UPI001687C99D|nr:hypothetical protein [Microcoleus sp. FACHB-672]MBD2040308.1 hypothetical protein [Microcoleus sp. FACHB-672]